MMKKLLAVAAIATLCLTSCQSTNAGTSAGKGLADNCLFQPEKAAKVTVEYEGEAIGFCCKKCKGKFEKLDAAGKQAAIAKRKG